MEKEIALRKEQSIYQTILRSSAMYGTKTALVYQYHKFSYNCFLKRVNQFAQSLIDLGYKKDDVITVCLPNIPDAIYLVYAINQIGAISNILHPLLTPFQIEETMSITGSKVLFCLDSKYQSFKQLEKDGVKVYACTPMHGLNLFEKIFYYKSEKKNIGKIPLKAKINNFYNSRRCLSFDTRFKCDAVYLNSGGTSGKAKIISLSSYAINSLGFTVPWITKKENTVGDGMLAVLPMFHGFGLGVGVHFMLAWGGFDVLMPKFNRDQTIKYIKKGLIKYMIGIPVLYEGLMSKRKFKGKILRNLDIAFVGGDFVRSSLIAKFNERMAEAKSRCRLREGYGLTETVCVCAVNTHYDNKVNTSGTAIPGVEFKIINPETLEDLGRNKEGEIIVTGDTLMNGYVFAEDKDANKKAFIEMDGKKWLRTGDFCSLDDDGYVTFKQRLKSIVKVSGVPVFPSMIEDCISTYKFVYECAAVGVEDEKHGHIVKLFVTLHREYRGTKEDAIKLMNDKIATELGVYSKPKEIVFMDRLPHTAVGKIDKKILK